MLSAALLAGACDRTERRMQAPKIEVITREDVHAVVAPDDHSIWIFGNYGTIYHSGDGGAVWEVQDSGVRDGILACADFIDGSTGWVVGLQGTVLHTRNSGRLWERQHTGTTRHLFGVSFVDAAHGWAVGDWGTVLHTDDGGATWTTQHDEIDSTLNSVAFVDRLTGWIVGERGMILHTRDGGITWRQQLPKMFEREDIEDELENPPPSLFGLAFTDERNGWACGIDGVIIRTFDGGETWEQLDSHTAMTLYAVFVGWGRGWIVGDKGTYLVSDDAGESWRPVDELITSRQPFGDVYFSSPRNGWVVGAAGMVVQTTDGGATWQFRSGISYAMEFFQMPRALEFRDRVFE